MEQKLSDIINTSRHLVFFGGAGVSTESGIPDFRSSTGLYNEQAQMTYPPEEILSHDFFFDHTKEFYEFYRKHLIYPKAQPNMAHKALANLEAHNQLAAIITQNIDNLHQKAGSQRVIELHGSVYRNICLKCHKKFELSYILKNNGIPLCDECGGLIKPEVVLYGEGLDDIVIAESISQLRQADTLIVGGTSLAVYPAAGLIQYFRGQQLILINAQSTTIDEQASLVIRGKIGEVLAPYVDK
jgi:NAD-dependent deacetylase